MKNKSTKYSGITFFMTVTLAFLLSLITAIHPLILFSGAVLCTMVAMIIGSFVKVEEKPYLAELACYPNNCDMPKVVPLGKKKVKREKGKIYCDNPSCHKELKDYEVCFSPLDEKVAEVYCDYDCGRSAAISKAFTTGVASGGHFLTIPREKAMEFYREGRVVQCQKED